MDNLPKVGQRYNYMGWDGRPEPWEVRSITSLEFSGPVVHLRLVEYNAERVPLESWHVPLSDFHYMLSRDRLRLVENGLDRAIRIAKNIYK